MRIRTIAAAAALAGALAIGVGTTAAHAQPEPFELPLQQVGVEESALAANLSGDVPAFPFGPMTEESPGQEG
ncbi:hypothetical protein CA983_11220 [Streptomyces swartbergensis]|uniref:Uncharacterized protein n=1 Tax=Streptomyces swartbergensis TaxID=487165 RepID=A0A243S745_9ACTN|nr:hypothetical protein CA983_11220 [Streptomyces swartbergensis]